MSDELREAAWWVVMNWDRQQSQHGSMPALRKALGLPPERPTPEEAQARVDEYLRDPSLWGRSEAS